MSYLTTEAVDLRISADACAPSGHAHGVDVIAHVISASGVALFAKPTLSTCDKQRPR